MKVKCYVEGGDPGDAVTYESSPTVAARQFCEEGQGPHKTINVIVVPLDEEAKALPGWHSDQDEPAFKMFKVTPRVEVEWTAREVQTLNPHQKIGAAT